MRLLLDMGLAARTAEFLRSRGHEAVHLREEQLQRWPDERIVAKALAENRVLVTFDLDFPRILALQQAAKPSVILFRLERFTTDELNLRLLHVVESFAEPLTRGAIVVVDTGATRVRGLPIL